jgi:hypothetical protein
MVSLLGIQMVMIIRMILLWLIMKVCSVKVIIFVWIRAALCEKSLAAESCALPIIQILLIIIDLDVLHYLLLVCLPLQRGAVNILSLYLGGALLRALSLELLGQLRGLLPDLHLLQYVLIQVPAASDILSEILPIIIQSVSLIVTQRAISKV